MTDKLQINNVIEAVLEEHVAATRSQRVQIRELLLDAIERSGFCIRHEHETTEALKLRDEFIVNKGLWSEFVDGLPPATLPNNVGTRPQPNDYARPDYCSEDGTRYTGRSALDEDDEDIQSLMDRDRE